MTPAGAARSRDGTVFIFDALRALAALAVLAAHARTLVFGDLDRQDALSLVGRAFFAVTALGHQAVIVFLVLSGALVTRSIAATCGTGRWSPATFAVARLSRLWLVLIPCLLVGGLEDRIGLALTDPLTRCFYGASGTAAGTVLHQLDPATLVGNIAFLQGFTVPVFGSNVPLWTLAVEAWCYAGALAIVCLWRRPPSVGALAILALAGGASALVLTSRFWSLFPVWLIGAALTLVMPLMRWPTHAGAALRPGLRILAGLAIAASFGAAVLLARAAAASHGFVADYGLGLATAGLLAVLAPWRPRIGRSVRATRFVAAFSYTLYLSHFPLLALLDAMALHHAPLRFGLAGLLFWFAAILASLGQAVLLWWSFERHSGFVRTSFLARLDGWRRTGPALGPRAAS